MNMKKIGILSIFIVFAFYTNAQNTMNAASTQITSDYVEDELIIWLNPGVDAYEFAKEVSEGILPKKQLSKRLNIWLFEFTNGKMQRNSRMNNLQKSNKVKYVQNNHFVENRTTPYDTYYYNQWAPGVIDLESAWSYTTGGRPKWEIRL